jgi:hypothetical protein
LHAFRVLGRRPSQLGKVGDASNRGLAVLCIDPASGSVVRYGSARQAKKDGYTPESISKACRGLLRTHRNRLWKFEE